MISAEDLVNREIINQVFAELLEQGSKASESEESTKEFYKLGSLALVQIKTLNRSMQLAQDIKRKEIETKKIVVDKLQLDLENLLYKQSYLKRDIRICKDISTPNLQEIEKELGHSLGTTVWVPNLNEVHEGTLDALRAEQQARIEAQKALGDLETKNTAQNEILDKKRKFLDEFPVRMEGLKKIADDLMESFKDVLPPVTIEEESVEITV